MCRILAIVSRKPIPPEVLLSFRALADTGKGFRDFGCPQPNPKTGHPDGWGLACVGAEGEFYARSPVKATADPKFEDAVRRMGRTCSPPLLLLAHLRWAAFKDTIQEPYCHPFRREVDHHPIFFALNGEIDGFHLDAGKTDGQVIFERFTEALGPEIRPLPDVKQVLAKAKEALDAEYPRKVESFTFAMIEGHRIIAHRDARTCVPYYTLHETKTDDMKVVCSEVLPALPGRWRMLRNGEFLELPSAW